MFLDFLFPKFCVCCGFLGSYICLKCQELLLTVKQDTCFYCHKGSYNSLTHPTCVKKWGVDGFLSVFYYNSQAKKIIKNIKYRLAKDIYPELLLLIPHAFIQKVALFQKNTQLLLQSVPLHENKLRARGFNQCDVFGRFIQENTKRSKMADILIRIRATTPQAQLQSKREKWSNIRGCFAVKHGCDVKNSTVLLVEDVVTTGSTVKEACKILKKAGASKVFVAALTKG